MNKNTKKIAFSEQKYEKTHNNSYSEGLIIIDDFGLGMPPIGTV